MLVPVAATEKLTLLPAQTVCAVGCVVMPGASFTVSVAEFDETAPHVPVTITSYEAASLTATLLMVKDDELAPLIFTVPLRH